MSFYSGPVYFEATSPGKTIFSAGHSFNSGPYFGQNNTGGGWTLLDSLWGNNISLSSGSLNTSGHKVISSHFSVGFNATGLDLDTSLMKVDFWSVSHHAGLAFDGDSATFYSAFFSASGNQSVLYNDVFLSSGSVSSGCSFDRIVFQGTANLSGNLIANHVWMKQNGYLSGDCLLDTLVFTTGRAYTFDAFSTTEIAESWQVRGNPCFIITLKSSSPGIRANVSMPAGVTTQMD